MAREDSNANSTRPGAPELATRGAFGVGVQTLDTVRRNVVDILRLSKEDDSRYDRPVKLEVWYPASLSDGAPRATYSDVLPHSKEPYSFSGDAVRDAELRPPPDRYSLVVVTHGYPGSRVAMSWLCENLASKGYVVAALDVADSTHADIGPREITLYHRPLDILHTVDYMLGESSRFQRALAPDRVGLVGYSMGGYASLNVCGAGFASEFVNYPGGVPKERLTIRESGAPEYIASLDSRIRALIAISPWGATVAWQHPRELAGLTLPTLFVAGDQDDVAGYDPGVRVLYEWASQSNRHLLTLRGAGHSIGLNPAPTDATEADDYYHFSDEVWDQRHVNNVLQHFATAFFGRHVLDEPSFARYFDQVTQDLSPIGSINAQNVDRSSPSWPGFRSSGERGLVLESRMANPSLPQRDPDLAARKSALAKERDVYRYDHTTYDPLAMSATVPPDQIFPAAWWRVNLGVMADLLENSAHAMRVRKPDFKVDPDVWIVAKKARAFAGSVEDGMELLSKVQGALVPLTIAGPATGLPDYAALFQSIETPEAVYRLLNDDSFVRNYLAGSNPMMLAALTELDDMRMALCDIVVSDVVGKQWTVAKLLAAKKLFVADYGALAGAETGKYRGEHQKYLPAPIAYFVVDDADKLRPLAIQMADGHEADLITPLDGVAWLGARTSVMVADANMSAVYFHHAKTHMVVEPFIVSMHRQLAPNHPVRLLLEPHFVGTLAINRTGQSTVFAPGGMIEVVGAATRDTFRQLAIGAVQTQNVRDMNFPAGLERRGVASVSQLPNFPFRDDGMLLWNAIEEWVRNYVGIYYTSDDEVAGDLEVAAWYAEVGAADGGRLKGLGEMRTRDDLIEVLSILIFSSSAQHWALNGPLADLMTFAPNYPLALWAEPRATASVAEWIEMLPPLEMAQAQLSAAYGMGMTRYSVLGRYDAGHFTDPRVAPVMERFQARLKEAQATIEARNQTRDVPYPYLLPAQLPASINI